MIVESDKGLAVSKTLSTLGASGEPVAANSTGVLLPYNAWHVPKEKFKETLLVRQRALTESTKETRAEDMFALATLYLGEGMGAEALGYLELLELNEPEFYKARKLALLKTAAQVLQHHWQDAAQSLNAAELTTVPEADLWREYLAMKLPVSAVLPALAGTSSTPVLSFDIGTDIEGGTAAPNAEEGTVASASPTAAVTSPVHPMMRFLKYNTPYIRFYPPRIRQLLAAGDLLQVARVGDTEAERV